MRSARTRLLLIGLSFVIVTGTGLALWSLQRRDRALTTAQRDVLSRLEAMSAAVSDIADAQQAYVLAPDALDEQWLTRVSALIQELSDDASALAPLLRSDTSGDALQTIVEAAAALTQVDARARQNLRRERSQTTLDLLAEGRDILDSMLVELRNLRFSEAAAYEASHAALFGQLWLLFGGGAMAWLGGLFSLARAAGGSEDRLPVSSASDAHPAEAPVEATQEPESAIDLEQAATVCTALSMVATSEELTNVLGDVVAVLGASGVVVWMQTGDTLRHVSSHGYKEQVVDRLGSIAREDDNITAEAWRTGRMGTLSTEASAGAIAVPILAGPNRCLGVLTTEVPRGREQAASVRAVASMFAAQLGAILGGEPAGTVEHGRPPLEASGM
jgi:hypothetical protein